MKVIQHSVETLQTALFSNCQDLAKLYKEYTQEERQLLEEGLHPGQPGSIFHPLTLHSDSDWISAHPEEPQNFESFYRDPKRKIPSATHNTIYIQAIGIFVSNAAVASVNLRLYEVYEMDCFKARACKVVGIYYFSVPVQLHNTWLLQ